MKSLHYLTQIVAFLPCHCNSISTRPCNCRLLQSAATSSIRASSSLSAAKDSSSFEKKHQQKRNSGGEKYRANHRANRTKRDGKMNQRLYKAVSREDRTSKLELKLKETANISESEINEFMPPSERAELNGLLKARSRFEEQYDPLAFTEEHLKFKAMHNDVFLKLSLYCQRKRNQLKKAKEEKDKVNVFFLDGPDGGTMLRETMTVKESLTPNKSGRHPTWSSQLTWLKVGRMGSEQSDLDSCSFDAV